MQIQFMLIGATKCATTWLIEVLRRHPQIDHSLEKSPEFFSTEGLSGGMVLLLGAVLGGRLDSGESSTSYLHRDLALDRIRRWLPEIRLLILLRNPWQRAVSHVRHKLRADRATDLAEYLAERKHLITDGLYAERIEQVVARFPRDSIRLFFYDEIRQDPEAAVHSAYDHVGADPEYRPSMLVRGHAPAPTRGYPPFGTRCLSS